MIKQLICLIFGHKYYTIKEFSPATRKVGCRRCGKQWAMNDRAQALVEWDGEFEELHESGMIL